MLVPVALVFVLASMIIPLSSVLLDFLIVGNLVISLLLLLSSLYISDTLKLSALPTILLICTLYRLSLNVASTRLILGDGKAGHVIEAFGNVVISGNLVVGSVIFIVITLIQFMVIAKGSERVAEVAARFTLDALPGKQMSVDADVRAGLIDFETARKRRLEMQTESRFYGALDGAMKFVKGDAIAGILIAIVNILAGFSIGVLVEGNDLNLAIKKYTLLTVGDGLVSQIPALFSALAAGVVVTRVSKGDGLNISQELFSQLSQFPVVKLTIAGFCFLMPAIASMPWLPFSSLGTLLAISCLIKKKPTSNNSENNERFEPKRPSLIELRLPSKFKEILPANKFQDLQNKIRNETYNLTGIILLPIELSFLEEDLNEIHIYIRGVLENSLKIDADDIYQSIYNNLKSLIIKRRIDLMDDIMTRRLLDFLEREHPELVCSVVPGIITVTQLTEILKSLVREDISIRNLELILQGVSESPRKSDGTRALLEDVRINLARVISNKFISKEKKLDCYVLAPKIDIALINSEREGEDLPDLEPIYDQLKSIDPKNLLLCSKGARALIRDCLRIRQININVLAHEEIGDEIQLKVIGIIGDRDELQEPFSITKLAA